jgi:hypothetical protein
MSMERTEVLDMMGTLKLFGMKGAYDEALAAAISASTNRSASLAICSRQMRPRDGIAALADAGVVVTEVDKIHCKTLLTRDANWLSAQRNEGDAYVMHETSWRISGANAAAAIESAKRELRERRVKLT